MTHAIPLFDGHNDLLSRFSGRARTDALREISIGRARGHVDVPKMRQGHFAGGLFAIYVPNPPGTPFDMAAMMREEYDIPLPPAVGAEHARAQTLEQASLLLDMEREGFVRICRTGGDVEAAMEAGEIAAIMHIEGAEGLDPDLLFLDVLVAAGLRSLGPVWSRPNAYGRGVPFAFPATPDTGPGLTDEGKRLVRACTDRGVLVDTAHMSLKEFMDVAELTDGPLLNSHSNAHAITPHARNLTDDQLRLIGERQGLVGLNYATAFLREDGRMVELDTLEPMIRHLSHMIEIAGEDCVGLGSDYDGALIPAPIGHVGGGQALVEAMRTAGFGEALIEKIAWRNWLRVLDS
ncbi:MAG: dipeptidase [Rubricella sp.]